MKRSEFEILLQEGEGSMLEYKENLSASFARELVAMANTAGGKILLGVRDDGTVKGNRDEARELGCPEPVFQETGFFTATFYPNPEVRILAATVRTASRKDQGAGEVTTVATPEVTTEAEAQADLTKVEKAVLSSCASGAKAGEELIASAGYSVQTGNFKTALMKLLIRGLIEMAIPDKPRSPKQRYRITRLGLEVLKKAKKEK